MNLSLEKNYSNKKEVEEIMITGGSKIGGELIINDFSNLRRIQGKGIRNGWSRKKSLTHF